ncbi:4-deoxy-L-threo-5-hexosulose-uronate ketol-isomerase [Catalinimonas alkaloidigena]|uniref:4-deoxy-L-threo-5-hexosulose-uronate ketol-isomerase n=1 Tax=Catalinimonas alkaloidigena TaxID=1075417 RepID=A0A1G9NHP8_9BACT|nr:5-dehydro-4-deoxy-D-glucuronate isomerase [Catalinimonas alkaloidigena]SDL85914.1 4-deoxy-L-threo-5-hexosulose-uronate ketol-isomerase [Catalinimonas alkaloidigena]
MQIRQATSPREAKTFDTEQLRQEFLIENLMSGPAFTWVYTHYDRMLIGGLVPGTAAVTLPTYDALKSNFFLQRRELGVINVGGKGVITADGTDYSLEKLDCLYLSRGTKDVSFRSSDGSQSARFYLISTPAHAEHPTTLMKAKDSTVVELGSKEACNERTIYQYIHENGVKSCQLVMGLTVLAPGSIWNTMPCHTHDRRMEAYFYYDVAEDARVFHFMGEPSETRHMVLKNEEAIISPPWSIHSGAGTKNYSFIWAMGGENQSFTDMDAVAMKDLR